MHLYSCSLIYTSFTYFDFTLVWYIFVVKTIIHDKEALHL
nr:MAG TPA: hypothetical protein [Caudoviricetes sp.]